MTRDFLGIRVGPERYLGVDVGTSFIKVIELSQHGKRIKLDNYGEMSASSLYEKPFRSFEQSTLSFSSSDVVRAVKAILKEAKMNAYKAYFSIPDFSTFFTSFRLPPMPKEELPQAVQFEARRHIPLPISEVVLDWQVIGEKDNEQKISNFNVLLVAVPNEVIRQYEEIARLARLKIIALEAEVFSLFRSLAKEEKEAAILIDIGARSTTVSIADAGIVKISHSFDTAGNDFTSLISRALNLELKEAEAIKQRHGILPSGDANSKGAIVPMIDLISTEIKKVSQNFYLQENKRLSKIILAGGSAFLPGLADYFSKVAEMKVEIANPFTGLYYPPILNDVLKKMGPAYAVAVGAALRGFE